MIVKRCPEGAVYNPMYGDCIIPPEQLFYAVLQNDVRPNSHILEIMEASKRLQNVTKLQKHLYKYSFTYMKTLLAALDLWASQHDIPAMRPGFACPH